MRSNKLCVFLAFVLVLCMAAIAGATGTVQVNVTNEPYPRNADCDKAGGFTLAFQPGAEIRAGEQITFDLQPGSELCKDINLIITPDGGVAADGPFILDNGTTITDRPAPTDCSFGFTVADLNNNAVTPDDSAFFYINTSNTGAAVLQDGGANSVLWFEVFGVDGDDRVTVSINGCGSFVVPNTANELIVQFLNQNTQDTAATPFNMFFWDAVAMNYKLVQYDGSVGDPRDDRVHNTYCISGAGPDSLGWGEDERMDVNFDSRTQTPLADSEQDVFNFEPDSSFNVAFLDDEGLLITPLPCKGFENVLDHGGSGANSLDCTFDIETPSGLCQSGLRVGFEFSNFPTQDVTLDNFTINIVTPGVYFYNTTFSWAAYERFLCGTGGFVSVAGGAFAGVNTTLYEDLSGTDTATMTSASGDVVVCDDLDALDSEFKPRRLVNTTNVVLDDALNPRFLVLDLPTFIYDDDIYDGEEIVVEVSFSRGDNVCAVASETYAFEIVSGQGCTDSIFFPYFPSDWQADGVDHNFWSGMVVNNRGGVEDECVVTVYDADGVASVTTTGLIPPKGMFVVGLSDLLPSGPSAMARSVEVVCPFDTDGFGFIAENQDASSKGNSMGYLPRDISGFTQAD